MPTLLPKDSDNNIIPAVRLKAGGGDVPQYGYIAALRVSTDGALYISEKE